MIRLWKLHFSLITFIILTYFVIILKSHNLFSAHNSQQEIIDRNEKVHRISKVLIRFNKALRFYEENSKNVNLDGLFGLRIAQGF